MDLQSMNSIMGISLKVFIRITRKMGLESLVIQMVAHMKAIGKMTYKTDMEFLDQMMGTSDLDTGKTINE